MDRTHNGVHVDTLVVFLSADALPADSFSALIDEEVERDLVPDELVLVVRDTARRAATAAIRAGAELEPVRARLGACATVTVVGFGATGAETGRDVAHGKAAASSMTLGEVGRRCATAVFKKHGGFVEANANYHFKNPSGKHTDRFMRLSNLLVHQAEISLIAMTTLRHVPADAAEAHVDTPAMFSIVAALNDHIRSLDAKRPTLACESFRSYGGLARHDFRGASRGVVLISASSSGGMAAQITKRDVDPDRIAHVLYLGPPGHRLKVAIDLSRDPKANPDGVADARETYSALGCALCDAGSIAVQLQGDQFDLGGPEFEPLTINKTDAPERLAATMQRLAGSSALAISLTQGSDRRQYLVHAPALLSATEFTRNLDYFARRHVPAPVRECIVLDPGSRPFAAAVCTAAGASPAMIPRDGLDALGKDDVDAHGKALDGAPILIAAAVIESGRALLDVSRDLRKSRPASPQVYLVGLAKTGSAERLKALERTLVQTHGASPHEFAAVESLILPPGAAANAWSAELAFLDRAVASGATLSHDLGRRRLNLRRSSLPLVDTLFVACGDTALRLQPGFVFWPAALSQEGSFSQADVFYTISSVLQKLRTTPSKAGARALRANWFQQTLLDPANLGRFNDGVIQACLLRAARPMEIDYSSDAGTQLDAERIIGKIVAGAHRPRGDAAAEVLIALGSRRLRLAPKPLAEVLTPLPTQPPLVVELIELCRSQLLPATD